MIIQLPVVLFAAGQLTHELIYEIAFVIKYFSSFLYGVLHSFS